MSLAHKIFIHSPRFIKIGITQALEYLWFKKSLRSLDSQSRTYFDQLKSYTPSAKPGDKKNILFYHINGLSFGGTEKFLQIIAKHLPAEKYEIWFMVGPQDVNRSRRDYLSAPHIHIVDFKYTSVDKHLPYIVRSSQPTVAQIIMENDIDLLITATPGHTIFPINLIRDLPIININIFGSFTVQKNIKKIVGLSHEVVNRSSLVAAKHIHEVMYIPAEQPPVLKAEAMALRNKFGIKETDFVFGRIGRPSDDIFDPIALNAFSLLQQNYPDIAKHCHYIIMAPSPLMRKLVTEKNIYNVHYIDPSPLETDVFAFHQAINCLAHARLDGETCGLNIAESMLCGNPVLTHTSHVWNAHLEYLDQTFARIAKKDDTSAYMQYMHEFYTIFKNTPEHWAEMKRFAQDRANDLFLIESSIKRFEVYITDTLTSK